MCCLFYALRIGCQLSLCSSSPGSWCFVFLIGGDRCVVTFRAGSEWFPIRLGVDRQDTAGSAWFALTDTTGSAWFAADRHGGSGLVAADRHGRFGLVAGDLTGRWRRRVYGQAASTATGVYRRTRRRLQELSSIAGTPAGCRNCRLLQGPASAESSAGRVSAPPVSTRESFEVLVVGVELLVTMFRD